MKRFIGVIIVSVMFAPLLVAWGLTSEWGGFAPGEVNAWIGFWGSYLGGLVSGIITLAGVYFGFKLQDSKNEKVNERIKLAKVIENYSDLYKIHWYCETILQYVDGKCDWDKNDIARLEQNIAQSRKALINIDIEWYERLTSITSNEMISRINYYGLESLSSSEYKNYRKSIDDLRIDIAEYLRRS